MSTTKRTDRMDIFIEEGRNIILIQERWQYNWLTKVTPWTITERRKFHELADQRIWKIWGGHFKLKVQGTSSFAEKHKNTTFTVNFDIKWALINPHWKVNLTKIAPGGFQTSYVNWNSKIISLDTEDTKIVTRYAGRSKYKQYPVAHEFGHAIGNVPIRGISHSDEYHDSYRLNGGFKLDYLSIMNIGNNLRNRHLDYVLIQLNSMFANTTFYIV
ncbi:hypothetical protein ETU08_07560 [Apibacter muscae]|uniref:Uncharacterized protein n=1 Tax=Apibacter muscae TaxID=2509004 RepID=A0A563DA35_9FLAO|nr:hypothetical protein [Apibacter muscae]TWP27076.1 hypothetical protein ETU09_08120 [Apibacter muscae]TWP29349.1 hypothetical protein ETU08_07560 [Apibacter muscae]